MMSGEETVVQGSDNQRQDGVETREKQSKDEVPSATSSGVGTASSAKKANGNDQKEVSGPPKKKSKKSKQSSKAAEKEPEIVPGDKYPYARRRGIRIFSDREIEVQDAEMTRQYWRFWDQTAEELCSDRAFNDWGKRDLKLYIDAAWIIHKTYLQEVTERQLAEGMNELLEKHGYPEVSQKIKNLDQAITSSLSQLQDATANLHELNMELTKIRGKHMNTKQRPVDSCYIQKTKDQDVQLSQKQVSNLEKNLYEGMSGVKRQQDSLKKALNRLHNMIIKAKLDRPIPAATATM
ncbi:hypothetical protein QZH41_005073 [Actinostola sp. cb2023]|nr:hypothetical protein QZH41_005073 [Actinostola sp. cb2023]